MESAPVTALVDVVLLTLVDTFVSKTSTVFDAANDARDAATWAATWLSNPLLADGE
jgi:hypothetical protein